jgi:hypothetical protein
MNKVAEKLREGAELLVKEAMNAWWSEISRQGDPLRRHNLTSEAFVAGWCAGAKYAVEEIKKARAEETKRLIGEILQMAESDNGH